MSDWAIRQAARELRGAGRHFGYLVACVTLGVAALVAVGTLGRSLERTVAESGKTLMGADLEIRASQPLAAGSLAAVAGLARAGARSTRVLELAAMAQATAERGPVERARVQLVEIKAVEPGYPFYGRLVTAPAAPLDDAHRRAPRAGPVGAARAGSAWRWATRCASARSTSGSPASWRASPIARSGVFSLGPRVLIAAADLEATGLVRPGSRVRHRTLVRLPDGADPEAVRAALVSRARRSRPSRQHLPPGPAGTAPLLGSAHHVPGAHRPRRAARRRHRRGRERAGLPAAPAPDARHPQEPRRAVAPRCSPPISSRPARWDWRAASWARSIGSAVPPLIAPWLARSSPSRSRSASRPWPFCAASPWGSA